VLALATLATAAAAQEQAGSIRGVVSDKDFDAPLAGARIQIAETGQETQSSAQGDYRFPEVRPGRYTLVFLKDGYVRVVRPDVVVAAGRLVEVSAALAGEFTDMDEFVVQDLQLGAGTESALLQVRLDSPALMDSIGSDLMSRANASDAAQGLRLVAGASLQDGKSAVIRGLPDRYVSSQMNGVRLPSADEDKRAVELDQFPAVVIQSLEVQKTFTPDQQGDASGGAVDVRLKGVPDEPLFVQVKAQTSYNTQVTGRDDFLSYRGGGLDFWGDQKDRRPVQPVGTSWFGAVGTSETDAPVDSKFSIALGGNHDLANGVKVGGFASTFYERDSSFYRGKDDSYWVKSPGEPMSPRLLQVQGPEDFKTALYDVTRGVESVKWGALGTAGITSEHHSLTLAYLFTHTAEDSATLAQDTRGKQYFFPGHDPADPSTPGHDQSGAAPFVRLETLDYVERDTDTLQLHGHHDLDLLGGDRAPTLDWFVARSTAESLEPDKRQFGEEWRPEQRPIPGVVIPAVHLPYKPGAAFTLGNVQRIFRDIKETSDQYGADLKFPFSVGDDGSGYLKTGLFHDRLRRTFDQDSFSNFGDATFFQAPFDVHWSSVFPDQVHPITASDSDVDYRGVQKISAAYAMLDLPVAGAVDLVGGLRFETTKIDVVNDPEANAKWFAPGSSTLVDLNPGDGDVHQDEDSFLPSVAMNWHIEPELTLRASYAHTIARQTFKELVPIQQQEYLGGPVFIGNPELRQSTLDNWDLRLDYAPAEGALLSGSVFRKDIKDAIEYVQRPLAFDFTTARNYPKGRLDGFEFEARQQFGNWSESLAGLGVGLNATFLESKVDLPQDEQDRFNLPGIRAPLSSRDMTNAPTHLYNAFVTYEIADWRTRLALFYTVQGDTLLAGAGEAAGNLVPSIYALEYDSLNFSVQQPLGDYVELAFGAKNLTNPAIETVYRSPYIGDDVLKTSHRDGVEFSLTLGGSLRF
jgi:outer membrane receptor protein involved in Fe transport